MSRIDEQIQDGQHSAMNVIKQIETEKSMLTETVAIVTFNETLKDYFQKGNQDEEFFRIIW